MARTAWWVSGLAFGVLGGLGSCSSPGAWDRSLELPSPVEITEFQGRLIGLGGEPHRGKIYAELVGVEDGRDWGKSLGAHQLEGGLFRIAVPGGLELDPGRADVRCCLRIWGGGTGVAAWSKERIWRDAHWGARAELSLPTSSPVHSDPHFECGELALELPGAFATTRVTGAKSSVATLGFYSVDGEGCVARLPFVELNADVGPVVTWYSWEQPRRLAFDVNAGDSSVHGAALRWLDRGSSVEVGLEPKGSIELLLGSDPSDDHLGAILLPELGYRCHRTTGIYAGILAGQRIRSAPLSAVYPLPGLGDAIDGKEARRATITGVPPGRYVLEALVRDPESRALILRYPGVVEVRPSGTLRVAPLPWGGTGEPPGPSTDAGSPGG